MLRLFLCSLVYFVSTISDVYSSNTLPTCGPNDIACMEKKANAVYQIIMKGDPERNIEPHEPLFQEYIEGNLSVLKYKYYNSTYTGMDTCKISNLSWDAKSSTMSFDYECAPIKIDGKYEITGRLIVLPIEGNGDYEIQTNGYKLRLDCGMNIVEKADGTKHWHINTYKLDATATGPLVFSYTNLFNGQKDLYVVPTPLVEIDDNGHADVLKYTGDEKIPIGSILKCGMDLSEPLRINHLEGGLVGMDYSLDDLVVSNFSKCAVKSLKMDLDSLDMNIYLDCPHLSMFGKYNVTGMIIAISFEGLGETRVVAENYGLSIKGKLEEFIGEDDQKHVKVKNFIPKPHYGGKVVYNLTNLFYGNEMLATEAHNYINGNWKAVSEFGQAPIMSAALRPFFKNINKCLKPIPVQNIEF